jgi:hypothetical protein
MAKCRPKCNGPLQLTDNLMAAKLKLVIIYASVFYLATIMTSTSDQLEIEKGCQQNTNSQPGTDHSLDDVTSGLDNSCWLNPLYFDILKMAADTLGLSIECSYTKLNLRAERAF